MHAKNKCFTVLFTIVLTLDKCFDTGSVSLVKPVHWYSSSDSTTSLLRNLLQYLVTSRDMLEI